MSDTENSLFRPIPEILEDLRAGRMVVLVDDEQRENEGDLVCAAGALPLWSAVATTPLWLDRGQTG